MIISILFVVADLGYLYSIPHPIIAGILIGIILWGPFLFLEDGVKKELADIEEKSQESPIAFYIDDGKQIVPNWEKLREPWLALSLVSRILFLLPRVYFIFFALSGGNSQC